MQVSLKLLCFFSVWDIDAFLFHPFPTQRVFQSEADPLLVSLLYVSESWKFIREYPANVA
jgi:hypothetical protein